MKDIVQITAGQVAAAVLTSLVLFLLAWVGRSVRRLELELLERLTQIAELPAAVTQLGEQLPGFDTRITRLEVHTGVMP